jgi:hypothetical protein
MRWKRHRSGVALVALLFAVWQFWKNARVERARFLVEMARHLMEDEAEDVFYEILHKKFQSNSITPGSTKEKAIDTLLFQFNLIGYLLKMWIIKEEDVGFFEKEADEVLLNDEVRKYMSSSDGQIKHKLHDTLPQLGRGRAIASPVAVLLKKPLPVF